MKYKVNVEVWVEASESFAALEQVELALERLPSPAMEARIVSVTPPPPVIHRVVVSEELSVMDRIG